MTNYLKIVMVLLGVISLSGCIKDGLEECPPEPKIALEFYAEKFQNKSQNALDDREEKFCDRIKHVRYYLYKDKELIRERIVDKFENTDGNCFTLEFDDLQPGQYEIVVIGNSSRSALTGDPMDAASLVITYPGSLDTEDYFTATFPFTVKAEESKKYEVGLYRAHGVIRYHFVNPPDDLVGVQVRMTNVGSEKWVTGDYMNVIDATHRFTTIQTATRADIEDGALVIGTFPTPQNEFSEYYLSLYREGEDNPYLSRMIADTLGVIRNQLIDIVTTFNDGNVSFEVYMDNEWDGSLWGGIGEVN